MHLSYILTCGFHIFVHPYVPLKSANLQSITYDEIVGD